MNREIKFRAFVRNYMVDVVSIDFVNKYITWDDNQYDRCDPPNKCFEIESFDEIKLMQSTGLKDKNGVEVYEKDYDKDGNMIDWCDRCCGYQFFQIDVPTKDVIFCHNCDGNFMLQDHIADFEVIGNIYESKELLKTK